MQKLYLFSLFLIVSFFLGSCDLQFGIQSEPEENQTETTSQENQPAEAKEKNNQEQEKEKETEEKAPAPRVSGLEPATDPEAFIRQRGETPGKQRDDPFSLFPVPPKNIARTETDSPSNSEEQSQPTSQANLAQKVQIQGALRIGGQAVAILKAPNEPTSRHVRAGESIAQGQVLVKEININARPTPTVVLEQLNMDQDVIKEVTGETALGNSETTVSNKPSRQLPPPPPLGNSSS